MTEMPVPKLPSGKLGAYAAVVGIGIIVAMYGVFLWASWQDYKRETQSRRSVIDEILDRLNDLSPSGGDHVHVADGNDSD